MLFNLWNQNCASDFMQAFIILHNMNIEAKRDGHESEFWSFADGAAGSGFYLDEKALRRS